MSTPKTTAINPRRLMADFRGTNFVEADEFYWSAKNNTVYYNSDRLQKIEGIYRLIHEIGHATSDHKNFQSGVQLLSLETEAWESAKKIAGRYGITIDSEYIENCLDSYRDWLHTRSTCPNCKTVSVEADENVYKCFNCLQKWQVSSNQRSRCYRQKITRTAAN